MTPKRAELHGALVVDKATGMTSHDAVALARRALGTRQIGHSGTLDPMATGVLILLVGEGTKLASYMADGDKSYEATLTLGVATSSLDADGEVVDEAPVPSLSQEDVVRAAHAFLGERLQQVPLVSAVKVAGRALYKAARRGQDVEAPSRIVRLDRLELHLVSPTCVEVSLSCGKGFYVRSLARDLAAALGTVGHLSALRRTANGGFGPEHAVSAATLQAARNDAQARDEIAQRWIDMVQLGRRFSRAVLAEPGVIHARQGKRIDAACVLETRSGPLSQITLAVDTDERPVAIVEPCAGGFRVKRGFVDWAGTRPQADLAAVSGAGSADMREQQDVIE